MGRERAAELSTEHLCGSRKRMAIQRIDRKRQGTPFFASVSMYCCLFYNKYVTKSNQSISHWYCVVFKGMDSPDGLVWSTNGGERKWSFFSRMTQVCGQTLQVEWKLGSGGYLLSFLPGFGGTLKGKHAYEHVS